MGKRQLFYICIECGGICSPSEPHVVTKSMTYKGLRFPSKTVYMCSVCYNKAVMKTRERLLKEKSR